MIIFFRKIDNFFETVDFSDRKSSLCSIPDATSHCIFRTAEPVEDDVCRASKYIDAKCPSGMTFPSYVIVFQYMILLKLILLPVLFALFSNTGTKVGAESDTLWKFQRYTLVTKFSASLRLPPPLNIFSLIEEFAVRLAKERVKISNLVQEVNLNEEMIYRIRSQIAQLEADISYTHAHLETLKYHERKEDEWMNSFKLHSLSRDSPYPRTKVQRFPVPDKYVPWEVMWLHYEPPTYTQPKSDFSELLQPYLDEDIRLLQEEEERDKSEIPNYLWNMEAIDTTGVYRNRKSWITDQKGKPQTYKLDADGLPRNPMGRSGLRGKGALPRWGPNHNVFIVITKWQKRVAKGSEYSILGTSDLLEFVETWYKNKKELSLPGGFAWSESRYAMVQTIFKEDDSDPPVWEHSSDMIEFFRRYATGSDNSKLSEEDMKCEKIYCGYMDDQLNTDQAWKEVELWHVHYNHSSNLGKMFKAKVKWRVLTEDVFIRLQEGQANLLHNAIRSLDGTAS